MKRPRRQGKGFIRVLDANGRTARGGRERRRSPETLAGEDNYEDALYKRVERDKKKKKGELMAPEVGGDLQRQNFSSDVVIDSSMFSTSRRSSLTKAAIRTASEQRGFDVDFDVIFVGASNSTCKAATEAGSPAGAHSVVVRTSEQRGGEFKGADENDVKINVVCSLAVRMAAFVSGVFDVFNHARRASREVCSFSSSSKAGAHSGRETEKALNRRIKKNKKRRSMMIK